MVKKSDDRGKSDKLKDLSPRSRQVNYFADISRALKSNMPTEHRKQVKIRARNIAGSDWLKLKWFNLDKNLSKRNC